MNDSKCLFPIRKKCTNGAIQGTRFCKICYVSSSPNLEERNLVGC